MSVHRTYHGGVLVVVSQGIQHGFVFEPGDVEVRYESFTGAHPRDPRRMTMTITGTGRMAAVHELPGGVQDGHGNEQEITPGDTQGQGRIQALEP